MSIKYKGHTLNEIGDAKWGETINVVQKSLIDSVETLNESVETLNESVETLNESVDTVNESVDTVSEVDQSSNPVDYTRRVDVPSNTSVRLLESFPRNAQLHIVAKPTATQYVNINSRQEILDWTLGEGVVSTISTIRGEPCIKLTVPQGFTGIIAEKSIGNLASGNDDYVLSNRIAVAASEVDPLATINSGAYTITQDYYRYSNAYNYDTYAFTYTNSFSVYNDTDGEEFVYRMSTSDTLAAEMEINIINVSISENVEGVQVLNDTATSIYYANLNVINGVYTTDEQLKVGLFNATVPTISSNGLINHTTVPMTVDVVVDNIILD